MGWRELCLNYIFYLVSWAFRLLQFVLNETETTNNLGTDKPTSWGPAIEKHKFSTDIDSNKASFMMKYIPNQRI